MTDTERIIAVIKYSGLSSNAFAKQIGYESGGSIYNKLNNKRGINITFITKIANRFTEINKDWLLTGKGEMLNTVEPYTSKETNTGVQDQQVAYKTLTPEQRIDMLLYQNQNVIDMLKVSQEKILKLLETSALSQEGDYCKFMDQKASEPKKASGEAV